MDLSKLSPDELMDHTRGLDAMEKYLAKAIDGFPVDDWRKIYCKQPIAVTKAAVKYFVDHEAHWGMAKRDELKDVLLLRVSTQTHSWARRMVGRLQQEEPKATRVRDAGRSDAEWANMVMPRVVD